MLTESLNGPLHVGNPLDTVAFSPSRHTPAIADGDHTVRLWDLTDSRHPIPAATLTGHTSVVESVAFSPDGHTLASASQGGTVRLSVFLSQSGEIEAVAFTRDGHTLASGSDDGTIRLWDTDPEESAKDVCALIVTPLTPSQWRQYVPNKTYNPPCRSQ